MSPTVSALLDEIVLEGGIDAAASSLLATLDRRHKTMVRRGRAYRKSASGGVTVADQQAYPTPAGLVEARELDVDGVRYGRALHSDIAQGAAGTLSVTGTGTVFMETSSATGVEQFALYPIPSTAGKAITVYGYFEPPTLLIDNTVPLRVDDDAVRGLKAGVWADVMMWPAEARPDLAATYEDVFTSACEEFRQRVSGRLRSGPTQIRMSSPYG
jgi:hypothetical protein